MPVGIVFDVHFLKVVSGVFLAIIGTALLGYGAFLVIVMMPLITPLTKPELRFGITYTFILLVILCTFLIYNSSSLSGVYDLMGVLFCSLIGLFLFQRLAFYWVILLHGKQTNLLKIKNTPTNFFIGEHTSVQLYELNYSYVVDDKSYDLRLLCGKSRNGKQMKKINAVRYNVRNPAKSIVWVDEK